VEPSQVSGGDERGDGSTKGKGEKNLPPAGSGQATGVLQCQPKLTAHRESFHEE
jgi:hypothetical protein